ncbi:MAG: GxxExxY protein [Verrucomicrobiota bacterium]
MITEKERLNELSEKVIGAAIEVHRELGPGLLESTYEAALEHELALMGLNTIRQLALPICYKDIKIDDAYRIDLLVEDTLIIEVKTVEAFLPVHSAQLLTYLRMSDRHLGLLINFHTVRLVDGIKRQVHKFPT